MVWLRRYLLFYMLCTTSIILPKQAGRRLAKGYPRAYSHSSSAPYKKDKLYMIAEELHISNEFRNNLRLSSFALCIVLFLLRSFFQNRLVDNSLLSIAKHSLSLSMISLFVFIFNCFDMNAFSLQGNTGIIHLRRRSVIFSIKNSDILYHYLFKYYL